MHHVASSDLFLPFLIVQNNSVSTVPYLRIYKKSSVYVAMIFSDPSPKRFELLRGNPMYLAGTRLNHSAKATR